MGEEARPARGNPDRDRRDGRGLRRARVRGRPGGTRNGDHPGREIPGICGIVKGASLPGFYGIEAGQSAVGDIFKWWVEVVCGGDAKMHEQLTRETAKPKPGRSRLLALALNH